MLKERSLEKSDANEMNWKKGPREKWQEEKKFHLKSTVCEGFTVLRRKRKMRWGQKKVINLPSQIQIRIYANAFNHFAENNQDENRLALCRKLRNANTLESICSKWMQMDGSELVGAYIKMVTKKQTNSFSEST